MLKKSDKKFIIEILLIILAGIVLVVKIDAINGFISSFIKLLSPLFVGIILSLFLNRPIEFFKRQFRRISYFNNDKAKIPAIIVTYLIFLGVLVGLFLIMIPQLIDSFGEFISNFDTYSRTFSNLIKRISDWVTQYNIDPQMISDIGSRGLNLFGSVLERLPGILSGIVSGLFSIVASFLLGLIISVYIMFDKKRVKRQFMRLISALLPTKTHAQFGHVISVVQRNFSTYLYTQITEGLILGFLFFIFTTIFGFQYTLIISVMNGLSVLIPIVGAWLGAIGGSIIVIFAQPDRMATYVILVVVLQIIESNIIYPHRMNDSVGLPQIWVLVSVALGGGLFGVLGAVFAVPVVSCIYKLVSEAINRKEQQRRLDANEKLQEKSRRKQQENSQKEHQTKTDADS